MLKQFRRPFPRRAELAEARCSDNPATSPNWEDRRGPGTPSLNESSRVSQFAGNFAWVRVDDLFPRHHPLGCRLKALLRIVALRKRRYVRPMPCLHCAYRLIRCFALMYPAPIEIQGFADFAQPGVDLAVNLFCRHARHRFREFSYQNLEAFDLSAFAATARRPVTFWPDR